MTPNPEDPAELLSAVVQTLVGIVFPPTCGACGVSLTVARGLCGDCKRALDLLRCHPACPRCAAEAGPHLSPSGRCGSCRGRHLAFDGSVRVAPYRGVMRDVLRGFKYRGAEHLDALLVDWMVAVFDQSPWRRSVEVVVAVPPHWLRRFTGGGYPATLLGAGLAQRSGLPVADLLRRVRFDRRQVGLSLAERRRNVRGAFRLRSAADVRGARIVVVDDVMTSGTTLQEIAGVLKDAGAKAVFNIVLARAGREDSAWGIA